ncbi:MAG: hypothetical protein IJC92_07480 [Bacteroidaceae bacterium]|nr:hypothetical protein [Bacteroidaceae bacterium]
MKRIFMFFAAFLFIVFAGSNEAAAQSKCRVCNGAGKVKTRFTISTYGISNRKVQCNNCGKWVLEGTDHYDPCKSCGGTGYSSRSSVGSGSSGNAAGSEWMSYLTPEEAVTVMEMFEALKPHTEAVTCSVCNGTGKCRQCGGVQVFDLDAVGVCWVCQGVGHCITCNGRGTNGVRSVEPQNKQQILNNIKLYMQLAEKRRREGF